MKNITHQTQHQKGLSLIELMISMLITLLLMLAVISLYVTSRRSHAIQDDLGRQQENSRFANELLSHEFRMAGFPKAVIGVPFDVANTIDGGGPVSDTIAISYQSATDCLGQATPANIAVNRYFIDANNNLACLGNGNAIPDVIAENIINMQILYGVDTDTTPDGAANKYVRWSNVLPAERSLVVSIRYGLLTSSPNESASVTKTTNHSLLDQTITVTNKSFHRRYFSTVMLRNRIP